MIREMQIKTTTSSRYYFTAARMDIINKKMDDNKSQWGCEAILNIVGKNVKWNSYFGKTA